MQLHEEILKDRSVLGAMIDSKVEDIDAFLKEANYNVTQLVNIKKGFEMEYLRVTTVKDQLLKQVNDKVIEEEKANSVLEDLYISLQRIEDRATLVQVHIEEKRLKDFN